ncbi:Rpn family recombination-promoting nuclease/putative transposase [Serratia marcescens]|nr:Rpn family recombination-promoting nuclease/putative transposase [Serratia marcescens]PIN53534.1 hypothetical protein CUB91_21380 [Serratia marcescens]
MTFRLMRYAIVAMQRYLAAGHEPLSRMLPILFYHGQITPNPYPMNGLQDLSDPTLADQLYGGDVQRVDVTATIHSDQQHHRVTILDLRQKHVRRATSPTD